LEKSPFGVSYLLPRKRIAEGGETVHGQVQDTAMKETGGEGDRKGKGDVSKRWREKEFVPTTIRRKKSEALN